MAQLEATPLPAVMLGKKFGNAKLWGQSQKDKTTACQLFAFIDTDKIKAKTPFTLPDILQRQSLISSRANWLHRLDYSFGIMDFAFFLQLSQNKHKMKINQLSLRADTLYIFMDS